MLLKKYRSFSFDTNKFFHFYHSNPIVYRCIWMIVKSFIRCIPNCSYIENLIRELYITGNSFLYKENDGQLKQLSVNKLYIQINNNFLSYKYEEKLLNKDNVLHLKLGMDIWGTSPMLCAQKSIELHNNISEYLNNLIKSGCKPSGILSYEEFLSDTKDKELKKELRTMYNGLGVEGYLAVLGGTYKWQPINIDPDKLQLLDIKKVATREISSAFDVPPILCSTTDPTFTNYKEARKHFLLDHIIPMSYSITRQLNEFIGTFHRVKIPNDID